MSNTLNILLAGFGGQGVLFIGKLIAYAGLIDDREVSWLPSYGPEMRGGTANCSVILSDEPIGSPLVTSPDVLVALNQPSFDKFKDSVAAGGMILADSTLVHDITGVADGAAEDAGGAAEEAGIRVFSVPFTRIAEDAGLKGLANVVCVGKLHAEKAFCSQETLVRAMEKCVPARKIEMLELNRKALVLGAEC